MSFSGLPDELIAHAASFLDFGDIVRLLQTNTRINKVIKGYNLHKPAIDELGVNLWGDDLVGHVRMKKDGSYGWIREENVGFDKTEAIVKIIKKFCSIGFLRIKEGFNVLLDDDFVEKLAATRVKIEKFMLLKVNFALEDDNFVQFCKKFEEIHLEFDDDHPAPKTFCDEIICRILPTTMICFRLTTHPFGLGLNMNISDISLDAILAGKTQSKMDLKNVKTLFTIKGIRAFVENNPQKKSIYSISMNLGVLNEVEVGNAMQWFAEVNIGNRQDYMLLLHHIIDGRTQFTVVYKKPSFSNVDFEIDGRNE